MALAWLVCVSKACSQLGPLLSLRTGRPQRGEAVPRKVLFLFLTCQNIIIDRKLKIHTTAKALQFSKSFDMHHFT